MICNEALEIIKRNEGCVLHAYQDTVGIWTIGYGHTGKDVYNGLVWSQYQADVVLEHDLAHFEDGVDDLLDEDCSDEQFGAMVSLAYNIGLGNFSKSSVLRYHNAGEFQKAAAAFLMWNKAGGRVLSGLTRRRKEERDLYLSGS